MPEIILDTIEKTLDCALDPDEVTERGDTAAQLSERIEMAEEARAEASKEAKSEIDRMKTEMRAALRDYRRRGTERLVECRLLLIPTERAVVWIRLDTGEQIGRRPARDSELQIELIKPREGHAVAQQPKPRRRKAAESEDG